MDFHGLIYEAHKNEVSKDKSKARYYQSSFAPPKKEEKAKGLSVNVKKFLARKEEEEKQRKREEERKREALLQLRNQDNKAKKRVQVMLKRTKSYNKSVLEDAIDEVNTADTMNGPQQCDEDDYGYVSQEASALYSKMMEKYGSAPVDNKFSKKNKSSSSDLLGTKDRVKMALQRQEEEEMGPHKRKRKKKDDDTKGDNEPVEEPRNGSDRHHSKEKEREKEKEEKPKVKRPPAPPPLDFSELLKIAEKKQYEPPPLELKLKEAKRQQQQQQQKPPERLMTKKEKLEYERSRDKRLQRDQGTTNGTKKDNNNKVESKPDRREKEKEDERKRMKEQKVREEDRYRRQREEERDQEKRRQEDRDQERRRQDDREQERRRQEGREQERRRQEDREQERRRQDREQERRRQEDREVERRRLENREQERRRQEDREQERRREEDKELQRERERIRELEEELARRKERERLREQELERREKDKKFPPIPKKTDGKPAPKPSSSSSSNKPKEMPGKELKSFKPSSDKATPSKDYRNGDLKKKSLGGSEKINSLFGDRDSASPERSSPKNDKPKPRPVERIKINNASNASVDDLFGDNVTIRTKQKPVPNSNNNNNNKIPPKSNDKGSTSLKPSQSGSKLNRDDPRNDYKPNPDRKRPSDLNGREYPEKRPRIGDSKSADRPAPNGRPPIRKEFPPKDMKSRQFPPADVRSRQFPPPDVRSRQFPPSDVARKGPASNRRFQYERRDSEDSSDDDEDDEYDSELDDFIDDGPLEDEQANVSSYIKEIFGYDKSRYANIDDRDDECMESNYAQVMREEKTSARIGLMEDIEDMKKEEMEKRLKAMRKMKPAKR